MSESPLRWTDPSADPIQDLRAYLDMAREATWVTKIEVNTLTLDALRNAASDAQRDAAVPGISAYFYGTPIFTAWDVLSGKARVSWSDGRVEVIP